MVRSASRLLLIIASLLFSVGCAGEFSSSDALYAIGTEPEFEEYYYAPLHIGKEVLTADNFKDPKAFIAKKYGSLIEAGLVKAVEVGRNSWRVVLRVELTEKGEQMADMGRSGEYHKRTGRDDVYYVAVCNLVPEQVVNVELIGRDTARVEYTIVQRAITPFGKFLGFSEGVEYNHSREFTRGSFGWDLMPLAY